MLGYRHLRGEALSDDGATELLGLAAQRLGGKVLGSLVVGDPPKLVLGEGWCGFARDVQETGSLRVGREFGVVLFKDDGATGELLRARALNLAKAVQAVLGGATWAPAGPGLVHYCGEIDRAVLAYVAEEGDALETGISELVPRFDLLPEGGNSQAKVRQSSKRQGLVTLLLAVLFVSILSGAYRYGIFGRTQRILKPPVVDHKGLALSALDTARGAVGPVVAPLFAGLTDGFGTPIMAAEALIDNAGRVLPLGALLHRNPSLVRSLFDRPESVGVEAARIDVWLENWSTAISRSGRALALFEQFRDLGPVGADEADEQAWVRAQVNLAPHDLGSLAVMALDGCWDVGAVAKVSMVLRFPTLEDLEVLTKLDQALSGCGTGDWAPTLINDRVSGMPSSGATLQGRLRNLRVSFATLENSFGREKEVVAGLVASFPTATESDRRLVRWFARLYGDEDEGGLVLLEARELRGAAGSFQLLAEPSP